MKIFGLTIGRESQAMSLPKISALGATPYSWDLSDPRVADYLRGGRATASGKTVTERSALSNATFFRAVNLISSAIGMLPTNLLKKTADGAEKDDAHPVQRLLRVKPNDWQTPLQFKSYMQGRALLHGNAYAFKVRSSGRTIALIPMDPTRVVVTLGADWRRSYRWTKPDGTLVTLTQDEVMHLAAPYAELDVPTLAIGPSEHAVSYDVVGGMERFFQSEEGITLSPTSHKEYWPDELGLDFITGVTEPVYWGMNHQSAVQTG